MKKFFYTLGIIAASAFVFSACQKELSTKEEQSSGKLVTVTFTAEKAGVDTRTAAVEVEGESSVSYVWTEEDIANIKLFEVGEDDKGKEKLTVVANPTVTKESNTELTISAAVAPGNHVFRAVLSGIWTNDGTKPRLNASQNPKSNNFDPNTDVLVSDDLEVNLVDSGEETVSTGARLMVFRRPIVVNKMTLKNLTAGETIDNVVITSDKNLTGYFGYNPTAATGDGKVITLNFNNAITVPDSGEVPVYFTTIPGTEQTLTVEVTTNLNVYTKSFGKTIDFIKGQFTVFGVALPGGTPRTSLVLPIEDNMDWATTGGSDATAEMNAADLTATQGDKKIYDSATKVYKGGDGMKFGNSSVAGSITTKEIDLSSAFYIAIEAKAYSSEESELLIYVDGEEVITNAKLTADYETYYVNCAAANADSKITIGMTKRGYITNLVIGSGTYVAPPKIVVTSSNPMLVSNENDLYAIEYEISNPVEGATLSAESSVAWIHDIDCSTAGEVSFEVDAQEAGSVAREGVITLSYTGANDVDVTVSQAPGAGGSTVYAYQFTNKSWGATLNGEDADWTSVQDGSGFRNDGIQVTESASGANGTSPVDFTDIEEIVITYCTNASSGVGAIKVTVGEGTTKTFNVTKPSSGGTTPKTCSFTYSPKESGAVKIEVTCSNNSIYLIGASIKAAGIDDSGSGGEGGDLTKGNPWTSGDFTDKSQMTTGWSTIDGVKMKSSVVAASCETSGLARGLSWSSGASTVITLSGYTGGIETVTLVMSTNSTATVSVSADGTSLESQQVISGTADANKPYTFTFSSLKSGDITITVNNTASKSVWIKSISIN